MTTTEATTTTLLDEAKALCAAVHASDLDDSVKAQLTALALDASFRFDEANSDLRQVEHYQASATKHIAAGKAATYELASLVDYANRAADKMREGDLKLQSALGMWNALNS